MLVDVSNLDETGKVVLDDIYNRPDPRGYFTALKPLEYMIPQLAKPIFEQVIGAYRRSRGRKHVKLLDVGCSYGVNAALLKHGMDLDRLYDLYTGRAAEGLTRDKLIARDRRLFAEDDDAADLDIVGLDAAERAVAYAVETGALDDGVAADLEAHDPDAREREALTGADIVISTGCIGYVGAPTFTHILKANRTAQPWLAHFVLRMFSFEPLRDLFKSYGYVTEKVQGRLFRQRRFASPAERAEVLERLAERGVDATGRETEGWLHAEFFLSRPLEEARLVPLAEICGRG